MTQLIKILIFIAFVFALYNDLGAQKNVTSSVLTLNQFLELEDVDGEKYLAEVYKAMRYAENLRQNGVKYKIEFNLLLLGDNQAQFEYYHETPTEIKQEIEKAILLANELIPSSLLNTTINISTEFSNSDIHRATIFPLRNADIVITYSAIKSCAPATNR